MQELEKLMYFGATSSTLEKARQLRNRMTPEETLLWEKLKGKQICNLRFRRQHPINMFIADFYCHKAKLIIELDGKIHLQNKKYDMERSKIIEDFGIKLIRFQNKEVHENLDEVIKQITKFVQEQLELSS